MPTVEQDVREAAGRDPSTSLRAGVPGVVEQTEEPLSVELLTGAALFALGVGIGLAMLAWWQWAERETRRFVEEWGPGW